MTDLFEYQSNKNTAPRKDTPKSNVPEFSVGDLALSLKRTLEDTYGRVRVRGEFSRINIAGSGHLYSSLKDDQAVIDVVCWKGVLGRLSVQPEEGLEVIVTGKVTSYPKSSKYQLSIESLELAGEGALLKMLEERKKKLAAEGLFAPERKKKLPFVPQVIGVVTSPTGAVIRDILHRLSDRFPRHVIVWPVLVQGDGASDQITRAIQGFDALPQGGDIARPDLLIVARGGGSLEDLMAFNEENVVRAVAECSIPVISAVGHETDTTLCDFAADLRAPTPTGAAEMAVPHRRDLMAQILDDEKRLLNGLSRLHSEWRHKLEAQAAKLGEPSRLLETKIQSVDFLGDKIGRIFSSYIQNKSSALQRIASKLVDPKYTLAQSSQRLENWGQRLEQTAPRLTEKKQDRLQTATRMLETLSYERTLNRGYVVVRDSKDNPVTQPDGLGAGRDYELQYAGNKRIGITVKK
ncbi:MAG: exodeoxyribonuclease VII large subunit [Alphaproteobacteria bacterium]